MKFRKSIYSMFIGCLCTAFLLNGCNLLLPADSKNLESAVLEDKSRLENINMDFSNAIVNNDLSGVKKAIQKGANTEEIAVLKTDNAGSYV